MVKIMNVVVIVVMMMMMPHTKSDYVIGMFDVSLKKISISSELCNHY